MTKHKHTPGPWIKAEGFMGKTEIRSANDRDTQEQGIHYTIAGDIGGRIHGDSFDDYSEVEANESLIAAAPDLLADLQLAAAQLRKYETLHRAKDTPDSLAKAEVNADLATRFERTIAKATA